MDKITARPQMLKQANLSLIRRVIKNKGTATRAEIAEETKISSTTVRSLLAEMIESGEIQSIGYDESSGGRRAERYGLKPDHSYGAAVCMSGSSMHGLLVGICGEVLQVTDLAVTDGDYEPAMLDYLDGLVARKNIKSIGIGVPGIVDGWTFWRESASDGELYRDDLGKRLAARYQIPVILENDLNATAIGFGRCYLKEFPGEVPGQVHMVYLYLEETCISAGIIAGGRVVRGCHNFAGELGLVPMGNGRTFAQCLAGSADDREYVNLLIQGICWICGILNPQYVVLGGPNLRMDCMGPISDGCCALLPTHMSAEILYSADLWHDYHDGMAYLTAGRIFDDIQFTKEQI